MFRLIDQVIFPVIFLFGTIAKAQEYSTEDAITTTTTDYGSPDVPRTTPCLPGTRSD